MRALLDADSAAGNMLVGELDACLRLARAKGLAEVAVLLTERRGEAPAPLGGFWGVSATLT